MRRSTSNPINQTHSMRTDFGPFLDHLVLVVLAHERGDPPGSVPDYTGPTDRRTERIERAFNTLARRMVIAETVAYNTIAASESTRSESRHHQADEPEPSELGSDNEETSTEEELLSLRSQIDDVTSVCSSILQGDLSRQVTASVQDPTMVQLKDTVNELVLQLNSQVSEFTQFATQYGTLSQYGGQVTEDGRQGCWEDLAQKINDMGMRLTTQIRGISGMARAIEAGDTNHTFDIATRGEMASLKASLSRTASRLNSVKREVIRVSREVTSEGVMCEPDATVFDAAGAWKGLVDEVNDMAAWFINLIRAATHIVKAVVLGNLTLRMSLDVRGEALDLQLTVNGMASFLEGLAAEYSRATRKMGTEGKLGAKATIANAHGTWWDVTDDINTFAKTFTRQVRAINHSLTAANHGVLDVQLTGLEDAPGEMRDQVKLVNELIKKLSNATSGSRSSRQGSYPATASTSR